MVAPAIGSRARFPMWRVVLLAVLVAVLVAVKLLPWWGTLALLAVLLLSFKLLGRRLIEAAFTAPFKAKGRVLRGATSDIHSVMPAEPPPARAEPSEEEDDDERPEPDGPRDWFTVEVTIRPADGAARPGGFTLWEPGELLLVPPDAPDPREDGGDDDVARVERLEIQEDGAFVEDEGYKLPGPQRLRMLLGVKPGATRLKFRYYFEDFGEVKLP